MTQPHEAQQEAARAQMEYIRGMYERQAAQGTIWSPLAARQQAGLSNMMGLGLSGIGQGLGSLAYSSPAASAAMSQAYTEMKTEYIKPDKKEYDIIGTISKYMFSDPVISLAKWSIACMSVMAIFLIAVFLGSELYEYISLMDV